MHYYRYNTPYYITSFCESGDQLGQWRGYANRGGGYAIGLEVKSSQIINDEVGFYALKVLYDRGEQRKLLNAILSNALDAINKLPFSISDTPECNMVI